MLVQFGVPKGSVRGPVLFTLYTQSLVKIIEGLSLCFHLYAGVSVTQLYKACRIEDLLSLVSSTSDCIFDVKMWMNSTRFKLNDEKTEFIVIGSNTKNLSQTTINIKGHLIASSKKVKNLGVVLNHDMSISSHVSDLCKNLYFQTKKTSSIRSYLNERVTKTLVKPPILSKLDYCNTLLASLTKDFISRLQMVQKYSSKLKNEIKEARPH